MYSQEKFNHLVVIADYIVKDGGAHKEVSRVYPNWIDEDELNALRESKLDEMRSGLGLSELDFGLENKGYDGEHGKMCIYRIVVTGPDRNSLEIDRLWLICRPLRQ